MLRRVDSRKDFMIYVCTLHNIVNRTLLKPVYPCNFELLEERWHSGCSECWESNGKKGMTSTESMEYVLFNSLKIGVKTCVNLE